jgi:hypothetical protein
MALILIQTSIPTISKDTVVIIYSRCSSSEISYSTFLGPDVVDLSVDSQLQVCLSVILLVSVADRNFFIPDPVSKVKKIPYPGSGSASKN